MISLVLAESALELVPKGMWRHPSVTSHARRMRKGPSGMLLDNSFHYAAMKGIKDEEKRGRPDLVHFSVLEATTIPLYLEDMVRLYVHTIQDKVITFASGVHVPKSYHRFAGLVEKLFRDGRVEAGGRELLGVKNQTFAGLLHEMGPARVHGLSVSGTPNSCAGVASRLADGDCVVVGGFQKGGFSDHVADHIDELHSVGGPLEGHVVVARLLYEYEKTLFM